MAAALASGTSAREYARASDVTEGAARWRLERVLEKTGARSQADLVRLVLGSLPGLT